MRTAPVAVGSSITRSYPSTHLIVPIDQCSMGCFSDSSGNFQFGSTSSGVNGFRLDPNTTISGVYLFGHLSSVASSFQRYRFHDLRFEYLPCCPTSTNGSLSFSTLEDSAVATNQSINQITSIQGCVSTAVWSPIGAVINHSREWKYMTGSGGSDADERLNAAGVVLANTPSPLPASSFFGWLRFVGRIEFSEIAPAMSLTSIHQQSPPPPSSVPPPLTPSSSFFHVSEPHSTCSCHQ